jgi:cephalosporin hydroxylase
MGNDDNLESAIRIGASMKSPSIAKKLPNPAEISTDPRTSPWAWMERPMFWRPGYLAPSAWQEHIPFAFWLMQAHRPRVVVELGVHYGVSYFAFCQAAARLGLDASCYGIDTFQGDMHSGTYDATVYEQVKKHNDAHYAGFSSIVRSTFDDALQHFQNGTIDLLHIDGMHTFDAVRADFDAWVNKLSPRAVVLMHDTNVRERGFGVAKMFQDLRGRYPHFEFIHGHGLGVLGVGKEQTAPMQQLFALSGNEADRQAVREAFASLGRGCAEAFETGKADRKAASWMEQAETRDKQLKYLQQCLEKTKAELDEANGLLEQRNEAVQAERERLAHENGNLQGKLEVSDAVRLRLMDELVRHKGTMFGPHSSPDANASDTEYLRRTCQEYDAKNRELESALQSAAEQAELAQVARAELEQLVERLHAQQEQLHLSLGADEQNKHELNETIVLFQAENSRLERGLAESEEKLRAQSRQLEEDAERIKTLSGERSASDARVEQLERELSQERIASERQRADLAALEKRIQELQKEGLSQVQQVRREAGIQLEKLTTENTGLRRGLEDARVQLNDLRGELDKIAKQQDRSEEISLLNRQHAEQGQALAKELASSKAQLEERFAELAEMTKMLEERFREIAMLTQIVQQRETELGRKDEELNLEKERAAHFRDLLEAQTGASGHIATATETKVETIEQKPKRGKMRASRLSVDSQISLLEKSDVLDTEWYLEQYEDVARSGMSPAEHYVRYGAAEGRQPGPDFDTSWYVTNYPDVAETGVNPAVHYLKYGKKEGRATYSIKRS